MSEWIVVEMGPQVRTRLLFDCLAGLEAFCGDLSWCNGRFFTSIAGSERVRGSSRRELLAAARVSGFQRNENENKPLKAGVKIPLLL